MYYFETSLNQLLFPFHYPCWCCLDEVLLEYPLWLFILDQVESQSTNPTSLEVWVRASRMSRSFFFLALIFRVVWLTSGSSWRETLIRSKCFCKVCLILFSKHLYLYGLFFPSFPPLFPPPPRKITFVIQFLSKLMDHLTICSPLRDNPTENAVKETRKWSAWSKKHRF